MDSFRETMQFVEANRHRAEALELAAAYARSPSYRALLNDIAAQRREMAEQMWELQTGKSEVTPVRRLRAG